MTLSLIEASLNPEQRARQVKVYSPYLRRPLDRLEDLLERTHSVATLLLETELERSFELIGESLPLTQSSKYESS